MSRNNSSDKVVEDASLDETGDSGFTSLPASLGDNVSSSNNSTVSLPDIVSSASMSSFDFLNESYTDEEVQEYVWMMDYVLKEEYQDALVLFCDDDHMFVEEFCKGLSKILLRNKKPPKVIKCSDFAPEVTSRIKNLEFALERCTYIFLFLTKHFVNDTWTEFSGETCLMEAINNPEKRWCVVPVFTEPKRSCSFKIPPSLNSLKGVQYWNGPDDKFYKESVKKLLEERQHIRLRNEAILRKKRRKWVKEFKTDEYIRKKLEEEEQKQQRQMLETRISSTLPSTSINKQQYEGMYKYEEGNHFHPVAESREDGAVTEEQVVLQGASRSQSFSETKCNNLDTNVSEDAVSFGSDSQIMPNQKQFNQGAVPQNMLQQRHLNQGPFLQNVPQQLNQYPVVENMPQHRQLNQGAVQQNMPQQTPLNQGSVQQNMPQQRQLNQGAVQQNMPQQRQLNQGAVQQNMPYQRQFSQGPLQQNMSYNIPQTGMPQSALPSYKFQPSVAQSQVFSQSESMIPDKDIYKEAKQIHIHNYYYPPASEQKPVNIIQPKYVQIGDHNVLAGVNDREKSTNSLIKESDQSIQSMSVGAVENLYIPEQPLASTTVSAVSQDNLPSDRDVTYSPQTCVKNTGEPVLPNMAPEALEDPAAAPFRSTNNSSKPVCVIPPFNAEEMYERSCFPNTEIQCTPNVLGEPSEENYAEEQTQPKVIDDEDEDDDQTLLKQHHVHD